MAAKQQTQHNDKSDSRQRSPQPITTDLAPQEALPELTLQRARLDPESLTPRDVLQLQSKCGNRTVQQMLSVQRVPRGGAGTSETGTGTTSPDPNNMTRDQFESVVRQRFGISEIRMGTYEDQVRELSRPGTPDVQLPRAQWREWDPGSASPIYNHIVEGFNAFASRIGGLPVVQKITFFHMNYDVNRATGATTPRPDVGALFGHGHLTVYQQSTREHRPLPIGPSVPSGEYERPLGGEMRTAGSTPGAPLAIPTREQSIVRTITHELGHGLIEVAFSLDARILEKYQKAVGWTSERPPRLFDMGVAAVRQAIQNNQVPDTQYEITADRWNDPRWGEQPMSHYMVDGGPAEDFPEAVMAYINTPHILIARSSRRYNFLAARMDTWRRHLMRVQQLGDFPQPGGSERRA